MQTTQLLQTKLQRPRVPRHYVPRPRLFERLDQGSQAPLTLVCAAAGYGKTTLVSAWIEGLATVGARSPRPYPQPGSRSTNAIATWASFCGTSSPPCARCSPTRAPTRLSLLQATRQPPFDLLCATLINEIAALPQEFILVLDDYHLITGTAVPDLFGEFERHWPQPMHLVLLSRYRPALSAGLPACEGALDRNPTATCGSRRTKRPRTWNRRCRHPSSQPAIELLERRTEGWIAGLQLASLSLRDAEDPEGLVAGLSGLDAGFAEYLADDVLAHQPAAIRVVPVTDCDPGSILRRAV